MQDLQEPFCIAHMGQACLHHDQDPVGMLNDE